MIRLMLGLLATAPLPVVPAEKPQTIVVTGRPLSETERALADCIARKCPPDEEIDRTLAHVENQFLAGEYRNARSVLNRAMSRNARFARTYPRPVADLYRVTGRIAIHLGEGEAYQRNVYGIGRSIRASLPDDGLDSLSADVETADMNASLDLYDRAQAIYSDVVARARKANRNDFATMILLRQAILRDRRGYVADARRNLRAIAAMTDPALKPFATTARILLARIDRRDGRSTTGDTFTTLAAAQPGPAPILLYAPDITGLPPRSGAGLGGGPLNRAATRTFDDVWGDFGFRIRPDGTVADVELLRESGRSPGWERPVLDSIAGRRYTAFVPPNGDTDGVFRVERYTLTALMMQNSGSRIRQRGPNPRYERLDLTPEAKPAAPVAKIAP